MLGVLLWGLGALCGGELGGVELFLGPEGGLGTGGVPMCAWGSGGRTSSAQLRGLWRLCWHAAALNQPPIFITNVHAGRRSWKAYHKGHIFNTSFYLAVLHI